MHKDRELKFLIHLASGMLLLNPKKEKFASCEGKQGIWLCDDLGFEGFPKIKVCLLENLR